METLLGSQFSRGGEGVLHRTSSEDQSSYSSPPNLYQHSQNQNAQDKLYTSREPTDSTLSPIGGRASTFPEVTGMVNLAFSETPWETMEWLDLMPPTAAAFSIPPPGSPSIFNDEFHDGSNMHTAVDLQLDQW